jgi:glutamate-1-semialdehyde 2,1-aminomutase
MSHPASAQWFERAQKVTPGGVNSPVRAFRSVGGDPVFIQRGIGAEIEDVDGNRYIDYVGSWGPLITGHAHPHTVKAIQDTAVYGTTFGATTSHEVLLAEKVCSLVPSVEKIRFVNSGTEATMSAVRLARGFTQRDTLVKFAGCYHGHSDALLSEAGSGVATLGIPGCPGIPQGAAKDTVTLPFNNTEALCALFKDHPNSIAAVIVEPIACNMGLVLPEKEFLHTLASLCTQHGTLLIFDEVITGFRLGLGGAQALYGITPDLTTFGKIIGGGLPVGAYGGRKDVMAMVAPEGPVYQAGTLSGNPLAMAAGLATLEIVSAPGFYEYLENTSQLLENEVQKILKEYPQKALFSRTGSVWYLWFHPQAQRAPRNYQEIKEGNTHTFAAYFRGMLQRGVYVAPSAFEVGFVSSAHTPQHIQTTAQAMREVISTL